MNNFRLFLRMSRWARNPPGPRQVKIFFTVIALSLALFGYERIFGWPEFLTLENTPRGRINR